MQINHRLVNIKSNNLEIAATIILLLYFLELNLPSIISSFLNALSYPIVLILAISNYKRLLWVATRDLVPWILIGITLASVFWTVDIGSTIAGNRGLLRTVIFGAYFATRYDVREQMKILAWIFSIAAVLSLIVVLINPGYGDFGEGWKGIFPHKNYLGYAMSLGAALFIILTFENQKSIWWMWVGFGLTLSLALLAKSSAALINLVTLFSLMPFYQVVKQKYKLRVVFLSLVSIFAGIVAVLIFSNLDTILIDILGEGLTFNGRTPIWTLIIEKVMEERLWLGYGYNAFWQSDAGVYVMTNTWAGFRPEGFNAHSGYLELLANLGLLGILVFSISLLTVFSRTIILLLSSKQIEFFWLLQFLVFFSTSAFSDVFVSITNTNSYVVIYFAICFSTAVDFKRICKNSDFLAKP